jgi:glucosamine--fructose-6-phosphate aminotransferase (isomerizing)
MRVCGIVACRRDRPALDFLISGLRRLEYRGYDSAGVAVVPDAGGLPWVHRAVGRTADLVAGLDGVADSAAGGIGIGHTRWATHGEVNERNAHPHRDCTGRIALVHNGIIENAERLRRDLANRGHTFGSDVDTEVVAHLVEEAYREDGDLAAAIHGAVGRLEGSWALAVVAEGTDRVVVACHRSPLAVAYGPHGSYAASDIAALLGWADRVHVLGDGDVVELNGGLRWTDARGRSLPPPAAIATPWQAADAEVGAYQDFMEKEIAEQPAVAARLLDTLLPDVRSGVLLNRLGVPAFERVRFVACGTSMHAAAVTARVVRVVAGLPTELVIASEHEEQQVPERGTLTVAFSQSGETADVLAALRSSSGPVLAVVNAPHSSLARSADAVLDCMAGPEIGVAATKTFTNQVLAGVAFALAGACRAGRLHHDALESLLALLSGTPRRLEQANLAAAPVAEVVSALLGDAPGFLFVSRGSGLPYAAEGALKLKEITYRWAESCPAGELKHGPIALIERSTPVVVVDGGTPTKLEANVAEINARGGRLVRVGRDPRATFPLPGPRDEAPWGPLESVVALQHLARSLAVRLGRDVDKPRNLAKSVTVE